MKRWREAHHLTQNQVAKLCGVTENTIARIERGRQLPKPPLIKTLMDITGLTLTDILIATIDQPSPSPRGRPRKSRP